MKELGYMLMALSIGLLKLLGMGLIGTGKLLAMVVIPLAALAIQKLSKARATRSARVKQAVAQVHVKVPERQPELERDTGPATIIQTSPYEAADRIVVIRLDPSVGVINLRVYKKAGVVKRDLIINEPVLKALMKGSRHNFPDAPFDPVTGLDAIKDETVEMAEKLINGLGSQTVKATKPRKDDFVRARPPTPPAPAPVKEALRQEPPKPAPAQQHANQAMPQPLARTDAPPSKVVAPRINTGYTYVGQLVKAGSEQVTPQGKQPYEIFVATLQLDNGAELPLRGAELERELTANNCQLGHRIAITPMGKVPVELANGAEGQKNLYRVQNQSIKG